MGDPTHPNLQDIGRQRQKEIYLRGAAGITPRIPTDPAHLEAAANAALTPEAAAYIDGRAGAGSTACANRAAFDKWAIVPRVLNDVSRREMSVSLFGSTLPSPLLLAPVGVLDLAHRDADLAVARAAASVGVPMIFSNQASTPMEKCAAAMGSSPRWFQLYWSRDEALVESFVRRAEACGCSAIVLTLDTTMLGWRTGDLDGGYLPFLRGMGIAQYTSDPVFRAAIREPQPATQVAAPRPPFTPSLLATALAQKSNWPGPWPSKLFSSEPRRAVERFMATYSRPDLQWSDLPRLRAMTKLPILLKGVLHPDDARRAVDAGMDGVIVSNHGGRQIDGEIGALDALPAVAKAAGSLAVLFDSGVRTGADIFKALALGARAVCIGRPYVHGLAIAGEDGVADVIRNLLAELDLTMGLAGCRSVAELTRERLQPA
ncbi:MAG TPA: lactate 2-monooxygenase [Opitutaceae bacterium]|nr:lactate 2-monooxygenase [Opitutaceae bacterium]